MYKHYTLDIELDYRLVGGIPRHPDIVIRWQEARWPNRQTALNADDPQTPEQAAERTIDDLASQALESEDDIDGIWTGFAERDGHLAIESRQIKAMLKESANILRPLLPVNGKVIPLKARLAERVFVGPHWISLGVTEPTGADERPIHVMTARGPRTALKRTDYIDNAELACELTVLNDGVISEPILRAILDHASMNGLGTDRSQGNGTFRYKLTEIDPQ